MFSSIASASSPAQRAANRIANLADDAKIANDILERVQGVHGVPFIDAQDALSAVAHHEPHNANNVTAFHADDYLDKLSSGRITRA